MDVHRVLLSMTLPGDEKGLKTFIQQFLSKLNIGCEVERILGENGYSTSVMMEASESKIHSTKTLLINALKQKYPKLQIPSEWGAKTSTKPFVQAEIHHTSIPAISRQISSGDVSKVDIIDDLSPKDSMSSLGSRSLSLLSHLGHLLKKIEKTIITVSYKNNSGTRKQDFDITTCMNWAQFLNQVDKSPELAIPIHTRKIYRFLPDGSHAYVNVLSALQSGIEYFVETDLDKPVMNDKKEMVIDPRMMGFYEMLKERKRTEEEITFVKKVFTEQSILFEDLIEIGERRMTDAELKEYGIAQGGLRKAILIVIDKVIQN